MVDPTPLDEEYLNKLESSSPNSPLSQYLKQTTFSINNQIPIRIHLSYLEIEETKFKRQVAYYKSYANKNTRSVLILHPDRGHMIHYKDSGKIIASILELL